MKTLDNENTADAQASTGGFKALGDPDLWRLLCKASSKTEGWMKSTKAMEIPGLGCLVQVTTQQGENVATAMEWVPGVTIIPHEGGHKITPA